MYSFSGGGSAAANWSAGLACASPDESLGVSWAGKSFQRACATANVKHNLRNLAWRFIQRRPICEVEPSGDIFILLNSPIFRLLAARGKHKIGNQRLVVGLAAASFANRAARD